MCGMPCNRRIKLTLSISEHCESRTEEERWPAGRGRRPWQGDRQGRFMFYLASAFHGGPCGRELWEPYRWRLAELLPISVAVTVARADFGPKKQRLHPIAATVASPTARLSGLRLAASLPNAIRGAGISDHNLDPRSCSGFGQWP